MDALVQSSLQTMISATSRAIGKAISALSDLRSNQQDLESKAKEQEDKRQGRLQNYLAAGPSPYEQNADLFYDPKKRLLFAEQIAGGVDESLKVQIAAAKGAADAAEAQIEALQDQQEQLEEQAD